MAPSCRRDQVAEQLQALLGRGLDGASADRVIGLRLSEADALIAAARVEEHPALALAPGADLDLTGLRADDDGQSMERFVETPPHSGAAKGRSMRRNELVGEEDRREHAGRPECREEGGALPPEAAADHLVQRGPIAL